MITRAKITNITLDNNNIYSKNVKKSGATTMKRKPYHGKTYFPPVLPMEPQKSAEQPLLTFQSSFENKKLINLPNGSKTTKSVYAKPNLIKIDDDKVINNENQQEKCINFKKPNLSTNKKKVNIDPIICLDKRYRKESKQSKWQVGDAQWKPEALLPYLQPAYTVILGESKGKKDYFRAFTTTITKPVDKNDRVVRLLPHRMKKTMRLYGVSPLLLLKKSKFRIAATPKAIERPKKAKPAKSYVENEKTTFKASNLMNSNDKRVNGPEIAPNFSEENEFAPVDFDFEPKNVENTKDDDDKIIKSTEILIAYDIEPIRPE